MIRNHRGFHHPHHFILWYLINSSHNGFVKISATWSPVLIDKILIISLSTNCLKRWYLIEMCLVLGDNILVLDISMQLSLSSYTLHLMIGSVLWIGYTQFISISRWINGITSIIAWLRAIYSDSAVDNTISVWSLLVHKSWQYAY